MTIKEIYEIIDKNAPFSLQCDWDNSGILVCQDENKQVKKAMVCTDITREIALEAVEKGVDVVISHHPVIFKGLKILNAKNPAVILSNADISAICCHTNVDRATYGLNHVVCDLLGFKAISDAPLAYDDGYSFGTICKTDKEYTDVELAQKIKCVLGCDYVRFTHGKAVNTVGICTGSGGDFIFDAIKSGCDALITGDVKHNFFVDAKNFGFGLFDAGHYFTEEIFAKWLLKIFDKTDVSFEIPLSETAPFCTI